MVLQKSFKDDERSIMDDALRKLDVICSFQERLEVFAFIHIYIYVAQSS